MAEGHAISTSAMGGCLVEDGDNGGTQKTLAWRADGF